MQEISAKIVKRKIISANIYISQNLSRKFELSMECRAKMKTSKNEEDKTVLLNIELNIGSKDEELRMELVSDIVFELNQLPDDYNEIAEQKLVPMAREMLLNSLDDTETHQIKSYILENTGFEEYGISTIGQALLSAYAGFANCYVPFKHTFNMLASGADYDENQVMAFWNLYADNINFQHIDFHIMFFDNAFHSVYTIKSAMSLILFEAAHAMDAKTKFVKCKNCGNYFVPVGRSDSVYCGYPAPQDKTKECRDVGANATRARKMKNDVLTKEYRRLYMRLKMAIKRHPDDAQSQELFSELTNGMKEKRSQLQKNLISTDGIMEWLSSFDNKA